MPKPNAKPRGSSTLARSGRYPTQQEWREHVAARNAWIRTLGQQGRPDGIYGPGRPSARRQDWR